MKKAILLYNPMAGNRKIIHNLDLITKKVQESGYSLLLYRSDQNGSIEEYITHNITNENTQLILISGGDGTLNECINGMVKAHLNIPLLILPLGTANDFAFSAHIPTDVEEALSLLQQGQLQYIDIGKVNNRYFINVCNMGIFSGVSHTIELDLKKKFGKLAYYVKSLEELQHYKGMNLKIQIDERIIEGQYMLVLIFNGKAAGGFTKIAKYADIQDGIFDIICIKKVELYEIPSIFLKVLQGEHLEDPRVEYLMGKKVKIECENGEIEYATDLDGEIGPELPMHITMEQKLIQIYLPK